MAIRRYWLSLEDEHGGLIPPQALEQITSSRLVAIATEAALELAARGDRHNLGDLASAVGSVLVTARRQARNPLEGARDGR